jgi:DNA-binding transcriptional regulator YiaG
MKPHRLDLIAEALPPGQALLLDAHGHMKTVIDYPDDPRLTEAPQPRTVFHITGGWLRRRREGMGWTQEELGKRIGVSYTTISRWEGDHLPIPATRAVELEALLGRWL